MVEVGDGIHAVHVLGYGYPVPRLADVPGFFQYLDPTLPLVHELLVVGHPRVLRSVGLAVDQILVSWHDVVGELELDGFVAEVVFEKDFGEGSVCHVLIPVKVAEGQVSGATEPTTDTESHRRKQQRRGHHQPQEWPEHPRCAAWVVRPLQTVAPF